MLSAILLDFDGVIVESVGIKTDAFRDYFGRHYPQYADKIVEYHLQNNGVSRIIKFKYIFEDILKIPFTEALKDRICHAFSNLVTQKVIECPMVQGAEQFLERYSVHFPMYLCSATPESELLEIVGQRRISHFFKKIFGFPTTKDAAIRFILDEFKCPSREILLIGDSLEDWRAARRNEVSFIARQNYDNFSGMGVQTFNDLAAVAEHLRSFVLNLPSSLAL